MALIRPWLKRLQESLKQHGEDNLAIAVSVEDKYVMLTFGEPTSQIGLEPDQAIAFANLVLEQAIMAKANQDGGVIVPVDPEITH